MWLIFWCFKTPLPLSSDVKLTRWPCICAVGLSYLQSLHSDCWAGLDLPHAITDRVQVETFCQLRCRHGGHQVLLVGKNEQWHTDELLLFQQLSQLLDICNNKFALYEAGDKILLTPGLIESNHSTYLKEIFCIPPDLSLQIFSRLSCQSHRSENNTDR